MEEQLIKQAPLSLKGESTKTLSMPATDTSTLTQQIWRWLQPVSYWRTFEGMLVTDHSSSRTPILLVWVMHCQEVQYICFISLSIPQDAGNLQRIQQSSLFRDRHDKKHEWWHWSSEDRHFLYNQQWSGNRQWTCTLHFCTFQWSR